jgi:hypothetical protein
MGDDISPPRRAAQVDGFDSLSDRIDLIKLDEYAVCGFFPDPARYKLGIGDKNIIADDLNFSAERVGLFFKAAPIVFIKTVFQ